MDLKLGGKYHGIICDCGAEDCYPTNYIGFGVPNIRCNICGKEWIISPTTKLDINNDKLEEYNKSLEPTENAGSLTDSD